MDGYFIYSHMSMCCTIRVCVCVWTPRVCVCFQCNNNVVLLLVGENIANGWLNSVRLAGSLPCVCVCVCCASSSKGIYENDYFHFEPACCIVTFYIRAYKHTNVHMYIYNLRYPFNLSENGSQLKIIKPAGEVSFWSR